MEQAKITFVINNNTYSLSSTDQQAIRDIEDKDRQDLLDLLGAIKAEEARARQAEARVQAALAGSQPGAVTDGPAPERLGRGDVDALMARLAMEDNQNRKPGPTREGLFKFMLGFFGVMIFLVVVLG